MWQAFIERRADIERFVQSITSSLLSVQDSLVLEIVKIRVLEIVKIRNMYVIKLTARYMSVYETLNCALHVQTRTLHRERTLSCASIRISSMKNLNVL